MPNEWSSIRFPWRKQMIFCPCGSIGWWSSLLNFYVIDLGTTKICIIHIWLTRETLDPSPGQQFALHIIHSFSESNKILFSTYISTAFNLLFIKTFKDNHVESSPSNTRATPPQAVLPCSVEGSLLLTRKEDVIFSCKKNVNIFHRPISLSNNKLTMAKVKLASAGMGSPLRNCLNKRNACAGRCTGTRCPAPRTVM